MSDRAPTFVESFRQALRLSEEQRWYVAYIPWLFLNLTFGAVFIVSQIETPLPEGISKGQLVSILSAFAVVGGFLGAFSISAVTQIQQIVSTYPFSDYLRDIGLFDLFIFFPQFIFLIQLCFIICSAFSILLIVFFDNSYSIKIITFNIGFMAYTSIKTFGLINTIRTLTWHYENYTNLLNRS